MRYGVFGFHKMLGSSSVAAQLAVSREGFTCVESRGILSWLKGAGHRFVIHLYCNEA
jgi:hypothetical protein